MCIYCLAAVWCLFGFASTASAKTLQDYKAVWESQVQKIHDDSFFTATEAPKKYIKALDVIANRMQKSGDLEGWQIINGEKTRFKRTGEVPKASLVDNPAILREVQDKFIASLKKAELTEAKKISVLASNYTRALEQEKVKLTRAGRIEEALSMRDEIERIESLDFVKKAISVTKASEESGSSNTATAVSRGKTTFGNVALAERGTTATAPTNADELIDGNSTRYTGSSGFGYGSWPCTFTLTFPEVYSIRTIKILLWDGDRRYYRYKLEGSEDGDTWTTLADKTEGRWSSWQTISFDATPLKYIRITGTYNSINSAFHIVEVEAYCTGAKRNYKSMFRR